MSAKKSAKVIVSKAYPHRVIADAQPVETTPTVRKGVSRAAANIKLQGVHFSGTMTKSKAKNLLVRPESSPNADSRTVEKSIIADGNRIIAVQG